MLNILLQSERMHKQPAEVMGVAYRLMRGQDCFRLSTCLDCGLGMELLLGELTREWSMPVPEGVLEHLLRPWKDIAHTGSMRRFSSACERGEAIQRWGPDFALIHAPECLEVNSCANCAVALEAIGSALLDLIEEGWDGERGRALREGAGILP